MKIRMQHHAGGTIVDGVVLELPSNADVYLEEVHLGVGIKTERGVFGIAQRDDGIEVLLNGKTVWTSHELA